MEEGRHDWNINEVTWDRHEMRAEWRGDRSPEQSAGASSAQQVALLPACSLVHAVICSQEASCRRVMGKRSLTMCDAIPKPLIFAGREHEWTYNE